MRTNTSKWLMPFASVALAIGAAAFLIGPVGAQLPAGLPKLLGGIKIPGVTDAQTPFHGLDALTAARDIFQQNKPSYPTPNIAISGNHIVIAWANGVVTIETIADDGTLQRTVLGPPTDRNVP